MVTGVRKGRVRAVCRWYPATRELLWQFDDGTRRKHIFVGSHVRADASHNKPGDCYLDAEPPRKR